MPGREYDTVLGRWLSRDPLISDPDKIAEMLPDGADLYTYCRNEPTSRVDTYGLSAFSDCQTQCRARFPAFPTVRGIPIIRIPLLPGIACQVCACMCTGVLDPLLSAVPFNYHGIYITECNYYFGSKYVTVVFQGSKVCPPIYEMGCNTASTKPIVRD
jgi:hypothetical protein